MSTTRLKGIWIPENIIFDTELSTTEKFVLSVILYLSENEKCCFASNRYISNIINVSTGRTSKIISKLRAKGYVEVKLNYKTGSKEIENRVIIPIVKNANTYNYVLNFISREEKRIYKFQKHNIYYGGNIMKVLKSKYNQITYIQIYLTKEEMQNEVTQEKIKEIKNTNTKVAIFVSGYNDYLKILEKIIMFEVEKDNEM